MKPKKYQPKQSESVAQQHIVQWFRAQYPDKIIFAIPNGAVIAGVGKKKFALINKMKREGMMNGVSDLFIAVARTINVIPVPATIIQHGMFLEMKAEGKTKSSLSKEQIRFLSDMQLVGYHTAWAAGFDQAKEIIEMYMKGVT